MARPSTNPMRRNRRAAHTLAVGAAVGLVVVFPVRAEAVGPCDVPLVSSACDVVGGAASGAASAVADGALGALTGWVLDGAVWLLDQVLRFVLETSTPQLDGGFFHRQYQLMGVLMAATLLPMLLLALVQGLVRQDWGQLMRSTFVAVPGAVILTAVAGTLVQAALVVTDGFATFVLAGGDTQTSGFLNATADALQGLGDGGSVPAFMAFLIALLTALAGLVLWLELLVRSAGIYVCVLFLPLTLAAMVWPVTSRWVRRLVEILAALVLSKLVIVAVIALAASTLTGGVKEGSATAVLAGAVMLVLACVSPFALLQLIPLVEGGNPGRHSSAAAGVVRAGLTAGQMYGSIMQARTAAALGTTTHQPPGGGGASGGGRSGGSTGLPLGPTTGSASASGGAGPASTGGPSSGASSGGSGTPAAATGVSAQPVASGSGATPGVAREGPAPRSGGSRVDRTAPPPRPPVSPGRAGQPAPAPGPALLGDRSTNDGEVV